MITFARHEPIPAGGVYDRFEIRNQIRSYYSPTDASCMRLLKIFNAAHQKNYPMEFHFSDISTGIFLSIDGKTGLSEVAADFYTKHYPGKKDKKQALLDDKEFYRISHIEI